MVREGPPQPAPYPAEQMRRDKILRRLRSRPAAFIVALALVMIVAVLLAIWR